MKRMVVVLAVVMALLVMTMSMAQALETWELRYNSGLAQYEVVYTGTVGENWTTWYADFELDFLPPGLTPVVDRTVIDGLGLTDAMFTSGQVGDHYRLEGINMATNSIVPSGTVLFTITDPGLASVSWDTNHINSWFDISGAMIDGGTLDANGQILAGGVTPADDVPVPPVPEIITIVLVSLGLIALGGYVWYRRHRQAAVAA